MWVKKYLFLRKGKHFPFCLYYIAIKYALEVNAKVLANHNLTLKQKKSL
jgi:hypothetical protein